MRFFLAVFITLLSTASMRAADADWTGQWDTRWRDGGARMELVQEDGKVTGGYPAFGGKIEGEVQGRQLHGRWAEGGETGALTFVLAPDGNSFMGRFDTGEWWTGGRVQAGTREIPIDLSGPRQAVRSFVEAGDAARAGDPDEWAKAATVMDFGAAGAAMLPGDRMAAAQTLFDVVDQTTFQLWHIPGQETDAPRLNLEFKQAGTGVVLPLTLVRGPDRLWRILKPEADLSATRAALLARSGGRLAPPDDFMRRTNPRDAFRNFIAGYRNWNRGGRDDVLATMDLSGFSDATRDYQGGLAATYLNEVLNRIGQILPQEIPDDRQSREPYLVFSHPAGRMVLSPANLPGSPDGGGWRFDESTVYSARDLYTAIEDMPLLERGAIPDVPSAYMRLRRWVRGMAPSLLTRIGPLETWQALGLLLALGGSLAIAFAAVSLALLGLRWTVGGQRSVSESELGTPLRLALGFALYRLISPVLGLPETVKRVSIGVTGVLLALAVMWGGWKLIDAIGAKAMRRAKATVGTLDEIVVSLILGALKLILLAGGFLFIAQALSLPYQGVLAGLGIGGLAVAFASKETLSNVFGAGILVADRPFRRGDWIEAGDAKGTVEHVGIRSTRIRAGDDSLVFIPNGKLADATVNNLGTRRHRVVKLKVMVAYGADPEKLKSFMDGLKELALHIPKIQPAYVNVGVGALAPGGIEVNLNGRLDAGADEQAAKTALLLAILRLANDAGVSLNDQDHTQRAALRVVA